MGIKSAFKGCLRFCGRPAISLRTSSMAVGWNLEWWFMDGREMETRGEGARERGNWINVVATVDRATEEFGFTVIHG